MRTLSREEAAKREIGRTAISPAVARFMVAAFLFTIVLVPTGQLVHDVRSAGRTSARTPWPTCCDLVARLPAIAVEFRRAEGGPYRKLRAANARLLKVIDLYEDRLADESLLTRRLLAPTQYSLTRWGGLGNEKAYVGRDGWLFYRPGVDYVTGPAFLDPEILAQRTKAGKEYTAPPHPDPRPAILAFREQLARFGTRLVLMPTPVKPMIEPERLTARYQGPSWSGVLQNPSFARFQSEMEAAGVLVFDPASALIERKQRTGRPQYLQTDTHWTPDAMQFVAACLSDFLRAHVPLPARPKTGFKSRSISVRNLGDIAVMLQLPADQGLFPEQEVSIRQILQPDGAPWRPAPGADILLLGDSFINIYSMPEMNWGEAAGFAEQLSYVMQRPIDRIAQNDSGAHATRQTFAQELARGQRSRDGLRVVIWQFAIRELAVGDWKPIPLPEGRSTEPARSSPPPATAAARLVVRGRIQTVAAVPEPGSVPYRDAITAVHLRAVEAIGGPAPGPEIVVYLWGMRDNRWTDAARYQPGQHITLELTPWAQAQRSYGRFSRVELDDPDFVLIDLPTFWADEVP